MSKELNEQSKFQVGLPHILHHHFPLDHTGRTGPASSFYPPTIILLNIQLHPSLVNMEAN